jgi:hypothetical protein
MPPLVAQQRLAQQHLQSSLPTPAAVVGWFGAVQAQDYAGALWALGMRMQGASESTVEQAFADGAILRTHVLRPTWHFVTPADIRWMLALSAPRVKALLAYNDRQWGIDAALVARSNTIIANRLQGGHWLARAELGESLVEAGIAVDGYRLGQLMIHAELDGVVCSGPRRGKQFTYALLEERVAPAPALAHDEAVAALTQRYFAGHGPATIQDFVWWSGLTVADAKAGLAAVGDVLDQYEIDGQNYWFAPLAQHATTAATAFLLPTFDEFLVGYAGFDTLRRGGPNAPGQMVFESTIMYDGQVIGSWKRTLRKNLVAIELAPFAPLSSEQRVAIEAAAMRYGAFLGLPVQVTDVLPVKEP